MRKLKIGDLVRLKMCGDPKIDMLRTIGATSALHSGGWFVWSDDLIERCASGGVVLVGFSATRAGAAWSRSLRQGVASLFRGTHE
jgi:hypothetical protein